ncbi:RNA12 protein-domain-containing protein [Mycena olivaceomarginata]|nr:RNA12 protein-domain-containing protein [Mycena olivaceomarginata]
MSPLSLPGTLDATSGFRMQPPLPLRGPPSPTRFPPPGPGHFTDTISSSLRMATTVSTGSYLSDATPTPPTQSHLLLSIFDSIWQYSGLGSDISMHWSMLETQCLATPGCDIDLDRPSAGSLFSSVGPCALLPQGAFTDRPGVNWNPKDSSGPRLLAPTNLPNTDLAIDESGLVSFQSHPVRYIFLELASRHSTKAQIFAGKWPSGALDCAGKKRGGRLISDNRENTKRLAKARLRCAARCRCKLEDADIDLEYTREQVASVERLGGRATDLENLIHKVRNGTTVTVAPLEGAEDIVMDHPARSFGNTRLKDVLDRDIIYQEVNEVRKKAFGDDAEDTKNLPWGREQAWALFKLLSKNSEIPYHEVLLEFPFKGDEALLRSMEHAELYSTRILPKLRTTAGSFPTSNRELIATWSLPQVITLACIRSE